MIIKVVLVAWVVIICLWWVIITIALCACLAQIHARIVNIGQIIVPIVQQPQQFYFTAIVIANVGMDIFLAMTQVSVQLVPRIVLYVAQWPIA